MIEINVINSSRIAKLEQEDADNLDGYEFVEHNGMLCVEVEADSIEADCKEDIIYVEVGYILGLFGLDSKVSYLDGDNFNLTHANLDVTTPEISYTGVTYMGSNKRLKAKYISFYYDNKVRSNLGYYYTAYDAAIVREYTMLSNKVSATPTGLILSFDRLTELYFNVLACTSVKRDINKKARITKFQDTKKSRVSSGVRENRSSFCLTLYYDKERHYIGRFETERSALIYRNVYILDNKIDLPLVELDITVDEQRELAKNITPMTQRAGYMKKEKTAMASSRFIGVSYSANLETYRVDVKDRETGKNIFIMTSRNEELAAMAYNVYTVDKGIATEPVNKLPYTIEEQREKLVDFYNSRRPKVPATLKYLFSMVEPKSIIRRSDFTSTKKTEEMHSGVASSTSKLNIKDIEL